MHVSIFDLDKTITRYATYTPFLLFAALRRAPMRLLLAPLWIALLLGYVMGTMSRKRLKERGFRLFIGSSIAADELNPIAAAFAEATVARNLLADAVARIDADRQAGALIVMATASPDFYAREIAARLGFDLVIATRQQRRADGRYSCRIEGENCYGAAKLAMIEAAKAADPRFAAATETSFYSDSATDAPTLGWATHAIAVNGSRKLNALATRMGWTKMDFS